MWYPSQPTWHPHIHPSVPPPPPQQQQTQPYSHSYSHHHLHPQQHAPYYVNQNDDSSLQSHSTTSISSSETSMHHYQGSNYGMRNTDYDLFHREEIVPSPARNAHCNPIITAPKRLSTTTTMTPTNPPPSTAWDWLLYSPDFHSCLYRPTSSSVFISPPMKSSDDEDELDLLASLPAWLLALLSHSSPTMDDENEMDQEIRSLHRQHQRYERDEPCSTMQHVSSHQSLSFDPLHSQQTSKEQHRSSTPDTDDGYQSASDASRSDYSQQSSSSSTNSQVPTRISYAAAVKPLSVPSSFFPSNRKSSIPSPLLTMNESTTNSASQKLKFIAPRFERMHHAKQYSSSAAASTTTTTTKSRSNPHGHRHPISHLTRRR